MQSAFAAVQRRWDSIDDPGAYLRRVVVNQANDTLRHRYRRPPDIPEPVTHLPDIDAGHDRVLLKWARARWRLSVVEPESRTAAVQQMLADIPVPAGFDTDTLASGSGSVSDRYQLGADVTSRVACAWIGQWVDATRTGDRAATQEAVDAMATSHEWDILLEMEDQGGWSGGVWTYADAIATDGTIDAGAPDIPVADSYVEALGCDTR